MSCQCRDFPQNYVAIPMVIATRNLFHNFLSLRSLFPFKIHNFLIYQFLKQLFCYSISFVMTALLEYQKSGPQPGGVRQVRTNRPEEIKVHIFEVKGPLFKIKVHFYNKPNLAVTHLHTVVHPFSSLGLNKIPGIFFFLVKSGCTRKRYIM